jgi:membrane protease YdiL (CAAX protease family)
VNVQAEVTQDSGRYDPETIPQFSWPQLVLFVALPLAWWFFLLYVVSPLLLPAITTPEGEINGWALLTLQILAYGFEFALALYLFRREGYPLRLKALKARINWRWVRGWKNWGLVVLLLVVGIGVTMLLGEPVNVAMARLLPPPDWFPASQHPLKEVQGVEDALPGVVFGGNILFLLLYLFNSVMNIVGEDLYYRGALIPKLHGLFGRWAWLAGAVIWPIKHLYVWWNVLGNTVILGLAGAYIFGPLGSLPVAMLVHFIGNQYILTWPMMIIEVLFGG